MAAREGTDAVRSLVVSGGLTGHWERSPENGETIDYIASVEARGRKWIVSTTWSFAGSRMEPLEVRIRSGDDPPRPVVGDAIRSLPLGAIQREARESAAAFFDAPEFRRLVDRGAPLGNLVAPLMSPAARPGPRRGQHLSDEDLAEVAAVYRRAYRVGGVTKAVSEHFGISESTAGKRIMKARAAGLLDDLTTKEG